MLLCCPPHRAAPYRIILLYLPAGFSSAELFRKYLWFLLREREFDEGAVADLVALKGALGRSDAQVGGGGGAGGEGLWECEAIREFVLRV